MNQHITIIREALEEIHPGNMTPMAETSWKKALAALAALEAAMREPVAWMSPGKERLEFSRPDTVYGSHTIPLFTAPPAQQPQAETDNHEAQGQLEFLDKKNNALSAAIRKVMARLADLGRRSIQRD